jgi:AcrR family transcriptional regulator
LLDNKRTRLLDATVDCCVRLGFHGTTTAGIAREARVATGTFFHYFPGKDAVLLAALQHANTQLWEFVGIGRDYPRDTVYDVLRRLWTALANRALTHPRAFQYWAMYGTTPGLPAWTPRVRLMPFSGLDRVLALVCNQDVAAAALPVALLEGLWQAAVLCVLVHPAWHAPDPRGAQALARAYELWWAGLGLPKSTPMPLWDALPAA